MEEGRDAFFVVRKGNTIGVYKSLSDCQAQVSSSVCDPSVSVFKGHSLTKEAEKYLSSCGLKNAFYSIDSEYVKENLFGNLVPCPFQQPGGPSFSTCKGSKKSSTLKRSSEIMEFDSSLEAVGSTSVSTDYSTKQLKLVKDTEANPVHSKHVCCILEFDGASKGNPGKAGAGAVLRTEGGHVVARLREGLGVATNNFAEYRAVILGLKSALMKGFEHIRVYGDSQLVCMQVQERWQTKNKNMADLCKEVKELKDKFLSFEIRHIRREFNSDADAQANLAINLHNGQVDEEPGDLN